MDHLIGPPAELLRPNIRDLMAGLEQGHRKAHIQILIELELHATAANRPRACVWLPRRKPGRRGCPRPRVGETTPGAALRSRPQRDFPISATPKCAYRGCTVFQ